MDMQYREEVIFVACDLVRATQKSSITKSKFLNTHVEREKKLFIKNNLSIKNKIFIKFNL